MTHRECNRIIDGLIFDKNGELALDESFRGHLDECPDCQELYQRVLAANEAEVPDYVPAVMQKIKENCTEIIEGLIVSPDGQLVLDESYQKHLDECSPCRELYNRVEAAKKEKTPNYAPAVMKRIREMESGPSSVTWRERLKDRLVFPFTFRRWAWASGLTAVIAVALVLRFVPLPWAGDSQVDRGANMVSVADTGVFTGIGSVDKQMSVKLDELTSKRIQLLQMDSQET